MPASLRVVTGAMVGSAILVSAPVLIETLYQVWMVRRRQGKQSKESIGLMHHVPETPLTQEAVIAPTPHPPPEEKKVMSEASEMETPQAASRTRSQCSVDGDTLSAPNFDTPEPKASSGTPQLAADIPATAVAVSSIASECGGRPTGAMAAAGVAGAVGAATELMIELEAIRKENRTLRAERDALATTSDILRGEGMSGSMCVCVWMRMGDGPVPSAVVPTTSRRIPPTSQPPPAPTRPTRLHPGPRRAEEVYR